MKSELSNLSLSVFYNQNQWHHLLANYLAPLIESNQNSIYNYFIFFSEEQGDNIRIVIGTSDVPRLLKEIDETIKVFLIKFPSIEKRKKLTETVFANFANNTHHFGLYEDYLKETYFSKELELTVRQNISQKIIDTLCSDCITKQATFEFFLYLQFALTSALFHSWAEAAAELKQIINNMSIIVPLHQQIELDTKVTDIVLENSDILDSFAIKLWTSKTFDDDFKWIESTVICFQKFAYRKRDRKAAFLHLSSIIMNHLNARQQHTMYLSQSVIYGVLIRIRKSL